MVLTHNCGAKWTGAPGDFDRSTLRKQTQEQILATFSASRSLSTWKP